MQFSGGTRAVRLGAAVVLALLAARLWHILLLRQYLDQPALVGLWLGATVVAAAVALRPGRIGWTFLILFAASVFAFHWGFERAASDGREYFVQLRSAVMDRDLDFSNENAVFGVRGAAKMYPIGVALLWMPFYILAHVWLRVLNLFGGAYSLDGFSNPYQRAIGIATLVYGCAGLVLIWRILRDYFTSGIAMLATIAAAAGTFFLWYITVENSMTHGASMFAVTLFLYVWHRGRPRPSASAAPVVPALSWWIRLGVVAGLMTLVRWQNLMFAVVAVPVAFWPLRRAGRPALMGLLACGAATFVMFLPQLVFWQIVRGSWHSVPAADHGFSLASLHILDVLFSPNHGLLATTPLVYFALLGLPFFVRRDPALAMVLIGGFLIQVVVNSGSGDWWGGPGFGARRFDSSLLAFGAGIASLLMWLKQRPLVAPIAALVALLGVNLAVMADVRTQTLPPSGAVTFTDMIRSGYARIGNPFSFPFNAYVAWKYDADWGLYDRLRGRTYANIDIDIGEPGDDMFLGHGWLPPETDGAMNFRWIAGPPATLVLPLRQPALYRLEWVCEPFVVPGAPRQTLTVVVNGARAGQVVLPSQPGLARYELVIPASAWRTNLNQVQFVPAYATSPQEAGVSGDSRALAVRFDSLRLRVVTGNTP